MSEDNDNIETKKIEKPQFPVSESPNLLTVGADSVQVAVNHSGHVCTFMFFQSHPTPQWTDRGIIFNGIHEEKFLEVKMSTETAFALSEYMHQLLKEIRANPNIKGYSFGPTGIREIPKKT